MSKNPFGISRRALLRAVAASPLLFAGRVSASEHSDIVTLVATHTDLTQTERNKLVMICEKLWKFIKSGAEPMEFGALDNRKAVMERALALSAPSLKVNLNYFDRDGDHEETMVCGVRCGRLCLKLATEANKTEIDVPIYLAAFQELKDKMTKAFERVDGKDSFAEAGPRALGCG